MTFLWIPTSVTDERRAEDGRRNGAIRELEDLASDQKGDKFLWAPVRSVQEEHLQVALRRLIESVERVDPEEE